MKCPGRRRAELALPGRTLVIALLLAGLIGAGCANKPSAVTASALPSPAASGAGVVSATVSAVPATPLKPLSSPGASQKPAPLPSSGRASPSAIPVVPGPAGPAVQLPKPGTYSYALSGNTVNFLSLLLGPQPYPAGAMLTVDFSAGVAVAGGTQVTARTSSPQDNNLQITAQWLWQPTKVAITSSTLTIPGAATYDCIFAPPPQILPNPIQTVTLAQQSWSAAQCSGSLQVAILGAESVTAAGQTWSAWRLHSVLHYVAQSALDLTMDTTSLFSPDLGTVITSDATSSGTLTGQHFSIHQVTSLTGHP